MSNPKHHAKNYDDHVNLDKEPAMLHPGTSGLIELDGGFKFLYEVVSGNAVAEMKNGILQIRPSK